MIVLRRCRAWATASSRIPQRILQSLGWRWQLLFVYLATTVVVLGISAVAIYAFFSRSLNQQMNKQLLTLARAATPSLTTVKTQGLQTLDQELPWLALFSSREQGLEWFNTDGKLLAKEGTSLPPLPLFKNQPSPSLHQGSPVFQQYGQMRTVAIAVYVEAPNQKMLRLDGYIRASASTQELENTLGQLRLGLSVGGITALMLISISGAYLTQQAIEPLKQTLQRLKQFTSDASHELRNPLTRISIATEVVRDSTRQVNPSDSKELAIIASATDQMQRLIEDLLFLARTEVTVPLTALEGVPISLEELLETLIEQFELQAENKGITLQTRLVPGLSIKGDAFQLGRLFSNLLENALKYTDSGGCVSIVMGKSKRSAIVSVEDTGIGIPPEYQPYVFQRFWRSDQAQTQEQEGLGLGLAIAQAIAKHHGGEISINSQLGTGTIFRVRLPLL